MTWGAIGAAAVATVGGAILNDNKSSPAPAAAGGGGGGPQYYMPTNLAFADSTWNDALAQDLAYARYADSYVVPSYQSTYDNMHGINYNPYLESQKQAGQAYGQVGAAGMAQMGQYGQRAARAAGQEDAMYGAAGDAVSLAARGQKALPGFDRAYAAMDNINYAPFQQRAGQAGQTYGQAGDVAVGQMGQFGQRAAADAGQVDAMYGAAGQVLQTAMDPQQALYDRTAHRMQDQVRAGQAARGLGNSEAGMMEEADAMSNFNIDWQNAQLARQATGIQAAGTATGAGVNAGRMYGADQQAALAAGQSGGDFYSQAGQVPLTANEYVASAPGRNSAALAHGYGDVAAMYDSGVQAGAGATNAGVNAGRMYGADQSAGLAAGAAGAGYYGQAGQVPLTATEYVAGAPARNGATLATGLNTAAQMHGNLQTAAIPYMNYGQGAQQANWNNANQAYQNGYQANRDQAAALGQMAQAVIPKAVDWWNGPSAGSPPNPYWSDGNWSDASGSYAQYAQPDYGSYY